MKEAQKEIPIVLDSKLKTLYTHYTLLGNLLGSEGRALFCTCPVFHYTHTGPPSCIISLLLPNLLQYLLFFTVGRNWRIWGSLRRSVNLSLQLCSRRKVFHFLPTDAQLNDKVTAHLAFLGIISPFVASCNWQQAPTERVLLRTLAILEVTDQISWLLPVYLQ